MYRRARTNKSRHLFTIPEEKSCQGFPCAGDGASPTDGYILVNKERRSRGLAPLVSSPDLERLARMHVNFMAQQQNVTHSVANIAQLKANLRSDQVGENVQRGISVEAMHQDTMTKYKVNRSNILSPSFNEMAYATAWGPDGLLYSCQLFRYNNPYNQQ